MPRRSHRILVTADWHIGDYRGPVVNGLNGRLIDVRNRISELIEYAVSNSIEAIVFCGDMFRDKHPGMIHLKTAASIIKEISSKQIKFIAIPGNHDVSKLRMHAHALSAFKPLTPNNVVIADQPGVFELDLNTRLLLFPYMSSPQDKPLKEFLKDARKDDILVMHGTIEGSLMTKLTDYEIHDEDTIFMDTISKVRGVFAGHIHDNQHYGKVWYPGSLERLSFDEEYSDRGFLDITIGDTIESKFIPVVARRLVTIHAEDINDVETGKLNIKDAVVRVVGADKQNVSDIRRLLTDKGVYYITNIQTLGVEFREAPKTGLGVPDLVKRYAQKIGYKGDMDNATRAILEVLNSIPTA